jgi:hypothetical protein
MPPKVLTIEFKNGTWDVDDHNAHGKKKDGVRFYVIPAAGKLGCKLCFADSSVFGVNEMLLPLYEYEPPHSIINIGQSLYIVIDACDSFPARSEWNLQGGPYTITIDT